MSKRDEVRNLREWRYEQKLLDSVMEQDKSGVVDVIMQASNVIDGVRSQLLDKRAEYAPELLESVLLHAGPRHPKVIKDYRDKTERYGKYDRAIAFLDKVCKEEKKQAAIFRQSQGASAEVKFSDGEMAELLGIKEDKLRRLKSIFDGKPAETEAEVDPGEGNTP